jgi:hypothetical protein
VTKLIEKLITFCGQPAKVACDGNCGKAWGINKRPCVLLSPTNVDDYAWLADDELGEAPADPGTREGGHAKPLVVTGPEDLNKWCVRECERCEMSPPGKSDERLGLRDFSRRLYNIESSDPERWS